MFYDLIELVSQAAITLVDRLGYAGVVLGMAIESINIPLPSEVIMPLAGALIATGRFDFWWLTLAGAAGNVIGSIGNYYLGAYGGRPFIERYGKYLLIRHEDLERADRWFQKYGLAAVFFARLVPVIRTFISFPAGVSRVPLVPFVILTFLGSLIWSALLVYLGLTFGEHYEDVIRPIFQRFDVIVGVLLIASLVWYVARHLYPVGARRQ